MIALAALLLAATAASPSAAQPAGVGPCECACFERPFPGGPCLKCGRCPDEDPEFAKLARELGRAELNVERARSAAASAARAARAAPAEGDAAGPLEVECFQLALGNWSCHAPRPRGPQEGQEDLYILGGINSKADPLDTVSWGADLRRLA